MASKTTDQVEKENFLDGASYQRENLTMISGSCYIPKDRESKPQGQDAHFIRTDKQTIGVADGVGGWSSKGIDAGEYARQLMANAEIAVQNQPNDKVDPNRVLNEAHSMTNVQGGSTTCIITLEGHSLRVVNVGDSGFILIRKGADIYQSPIQQHRFNCPYQLTNDESSDDAQVFTVPIEAGDVIVAGTDGLFDNLFATQIEEAARLGIEQGLDPQEVAWNVAEHAYYTSTDGNAFTPFMQASIESTKTHNGGKKDDITVIVSYIVAA